MAKPFRAMSSGQKRFKTVKVSKVPQESQESRPHDRFRLDNQMIETYTGSLDDVENDDTFPLEVDVPSSSNWESRVRQWKTFWDEAKPILLDSYLRREDKWSLCVDCECTSGLPGCAQLDDCECSSQQFEIITCIISLRGKHKAPR